MYNLAINQVSLIDLAPVLSANASEYILRMPLKSIFHVLMVCPNEKWVLQLGKIVHCWKRYVDGSTPKPLFLFGQK